MTVTVSADGVILLKGTCALDDAEPLLRSLADNPHALIDWTGCDHIHTAVVQVLMAAKPRIVGSPTHSFLRDHFTSLA
jgi:hypothetical protein